MLGRVRDSIVNAPDDFAEVIQSADFVREFGTINGERLKRLPAGVPANAPFQEELKLTGFWVGKSRDARGATWSDLAATVAGDYRLMNPFLVLAAPGERTRLGRSPPLDAIGRPAKNWGIVALRFGQRGRI